MGSTEAEEVLKGKFYDLSFAVDKSIRYHEKLCAFYSWWRDGMKLATLLSSSSAAVLIYNNLPAIAIVITSLITIWTIFDYVFSPDQKAQLHKDLCNRFRDLAAKIQTLDATEETYRLLAGTRIDIEKAEPPCKRLVDLAARNDECRARDFPPNDLVPLSWLQRHAGYFFTFGMARLERWKADKSK